MQDLLDDDGPGRDRTCDLGIKSPLLYQLSYRPRPECTPRSARAIRCALPRLQELFDVSPLLVGELELRDEPPRLGRVVVLDRRLEMLAQGRRLAELASQPAEQAHLRGFHMGGDGLEPPTPCL